MSSSSRRSFPLPSNWVHIRRIVLIRDRGMCKYGLLPDEDFAVGDCLQPATEVDHIGKPWQHEIEFLRSLCAGHHQSRTSRQANAAKKRLNELNPRARPPKDHPGLRK
jgi:5-methylcytosine-specific restriction protein A